MKESYFSSKFINFAPNLNRLKVVLVEQGKKENGLQNN